MCTAGKQGNAADARQNREARQEAGDDEGEGKGIANSRCWDGSGSRGEEASEVEGERDAGKTSGWPCF